MPSCDVDAARAESRYCGWYATYVGADPLGCAEANAPCDARETTAGVDARGWYGLPRGYALECGTDAVYPDG